MENYLEKLFILESIIFAVIGILFFINPLESLLNLTILLGVLIIVSAIFKLTRALKNEYRFSYLLSGGLDILFGLILIFSPINTIEMMLIFYGVWSLMRGLATLLLSFKGNTFGLNIKTVGALVAIAAGLLIILSPYVFVFALSYIPYLIGAYFIAIACLELYLGAKNQSQKGDSF